MKVLNSLQQSLSFGPVNLPLIFLPLFIAWIIYQILIKRFYRERIAELQRVDRLMFNGLFIIVAVWKLSPLVFQFSTVIKNPAAVLYLPGGAAGIAAGIAAAIVFYTVSLLKQKEDRPALFRSLIFNSGVLLVLTIVLSFGTSIIFSRMEEQPETSFSLSGQEAPGFILEGEDGKSYQLSDYSGKTIVLNFWASWCPPCRAELPELRKFYNELSPEEVVFLSINLFTTERNPESLPQFIEDEDLDFPVLYDKRGQVAADYGVESIPTTVIIGRDGAVDYIKSGAVTNAWLRRAVTR